MFILTIRDGIVPVIMHSLVHDFGRICIKSDIKNTTPVHKTDKKFCQKFCIQFCSISPVALITETFVDILAFQ